MLYFKDTEIVNQFKQIENRQLLTRENYLGYLESDYYERMVEEHKDELGHYGRVQDLRDMWHDPTGQIKGLSRYIAKDIESLTEDTSLLQQID